MTPKTSPRRRRRRRRRARRKLRAPNPRTRRPPRGRRQRPPWVSTDGTAHPRGRGRREGSSPSSVAGAGKGKEGGGGKSPGIEPTAFEFVAIPTAPAPTRDANLAGKRGVGRAKLRARRNAPTPARGARGGRSRRRRRSPTETGQPAARIEVEPFGYPRRFRRSKRPGTSTPSPMNRTASQPTLARARASVVGTFVPRSDGTGGESPEPLVGSSAIRRVGRGGCRRGGGGIGGALAARAAGAEAAAAADVSLGGGRGSLRRGVRGRQAASQRVTFTRRRRSKKS